MKLKTKHIKVTFIAAARASRKLPSELTTKSINVKIPADLSSATLRDDRSIAAPEYDLMQYSQLNVAVPCD
jgi:hypothetical protein